MTIDPKLKSKQHKKNKLIASVKYKFADRNKLKYLKRRPSKEKEIKEYLEYIASKAEKAKEEFFSRKSTRKKINHLIF